MRFDPLGRDVELAVNPDPLIGDDAVELRHVPRPLTRWGLHKNLPSIYPGDLEVVIDGTRFRQTTLSRVYWPTTPRSQAHG